MEVQKNTASDLSGSDEKKKIWVKPTVDVISQDLVQGGNAGGIEGASPSAGPVS